MIKTIYRSDEVIDFAWELSQDDLNASYPRRKSTKVVERELKRAICEYNYI